MSGHRSVFWIYRTLKYMAEQGLEVPARIDFSLYPNPPFAFFNDATVVNRVFDDLEVGNRRIFNFEIWDSNSENARKWDSRANHDSKGCVILLQGN